MESSGHPSDAGGFWCGQRSPHCGGRGKRDAIDTSLRTSAQRPRTFAGILVNTANITTSYLWFALTFWVYLETRKLIATAYAQAAAEAAEKAASPALDE
ncbi:hypothetical protein ABIB17_001509 [Arthrobacter sp. UYEF6]